MRDAQLKIGIAAGVTNVVLGWILVATPLGLPFVHWSYDLLQLFLPTHDGPAPVIIYLDEQAMRDYGQQPGQFWDRSIHARLLDRLTQDDPRVVVFDITMTQPADANDDRILAEAMRRNGRVVLAADKVLVAGIHRGYTLVPPFADFETNAAAWGVAKVLAHSDRVARLYDPGDDQVEGLAWAAARVAKASVTQDPERRLNDPRWLNYYGSADPFKSTSLTYTNAETRPAGFFRDKAIFIGGKPATLLRGEITDVFATPYTRWNDEFIPGVEVTAIAYANLVDRKWLRRLGIFPELGIALVVGLVSVLGAQKLDWRVVMGSGAVSIILLGLAAVVMVLLWQVWFGWTVLAFVQVPGALLFRLWSRSTAAVAERSVSLTPPQIASPSDASTIPDPSLSLPIPDHTLIRAIGSGGYGQVWLARNAIGLYHAVKVVYRNRFGTDEPYERALHGIQKFMPISRSHEGFVHILHVGRNDAGGFFFYIMEAGDDQKTGQQIDPDTYAAKTLASELKQRKVIPARECLTFMLAITEAVEQLHQHQLIHRDIKPANIIFVRHRPKLADIDLVTDLSEDGDVSRIGTEGYMAPEGPGRPAADVFSLGRVLYVALTGKFPNQCPELPTNIAHDPDCGLLMELSQISCRACDLDLQRRYASAAAMRAALLRVKA